MRDWVAFVRERLELPRMHGHHDDRVVRELADHLEDLYRDALVRGRSIAEAEALVEDELRERARIRDELVAAEPHHERAVADRWALGAEDRMRSSGLLGSFFADRTHGFRRAVRALARQPAFATTSVLVLALGIGSASAIFALLDAVVLEPLPFPDGERLVSVRHRAPSLGIGDAGQSAGWHFAYVDQARVLESIAMYSSGSAAVTGVGDPEAVPVLFATETLLPTLDLMPLAGRSFSSQEMDPSAPVSVLLGEQYWVSRFGADPGVIGRVIEVDGTSSTILGVAPAEIEALGFDVDLVVPLRYRSNQIAAGMNIGFDAVARLRSDVSLEEARLDLARVLPLSWDLYPQQSEVSAEEVAAYEPRIEPLKSWIVGDTAYLLWTLFGGVVVVLLMSCVNVASLVLVRADGRATEMAVRTALGAGRSRVRWEYFKESLLLGALGAAVGLGFAKLMLRGLAAMAPEGIPRLDGVGIGPSVIGFATLVTVSAGVVFGLLSARLNGAARLAGTLRSGGRGTLARGRGALGLGALASAQIALAIVLMVGAGLLLRTLDSLASVEAGFDDDGAYEVLRVAIPAAQIRSIGEAAASLEAMAHRMEDVPGVRGVAMATAIPLAGGMNVNPFVAEGVPTASDASVMYRHKWIGGDYFDVLGIDLVAGRGLTWDDARGRAPVAVISERLAVQHWGSVEAALGAHVAARPEPVRWHEVVGVAADVRGDGLSQDPPALVYWPQVTLGFWEGTSLEQEQGWRSMAFAVQSDRAGEAAFLRELEEAVWQVVPTVPVRSAGTMSRLRERSMARASFATSLLAVAALIAMLLGLVGVYGVIGYVARMQTREFGLRVALGASEADVGAIVLRRGLVIAGTGVGVGLTMVFAVGSVIDGLLFGVEASDPLTLTVAPLLLATAAVAAAYLPARRAGRSDPMVVIRGE